MAKLKELDALVSMNMLLEEDANKIERILAYRKYFRGDDVDTMIGDFISSKQEKIENRQLRSREDNGSELSEI